MQSFSIVEKVDVFKQFLLDLFHCIIASAMDAFLLCGSEKALDTRIVIGTSGFAHTPLDLQLLQELTESAAAVLTSSVTVENQSSLLLAAGHRIPQGTLHKFCVG